MFIHPKYNFYRANGRVDKEEDKVEEENEKWWIDVLAKQSNAASDDQDELNEIPININSTLKSIREFVKKHKLGIKCGGKGRTKAVILKDIENMMQGRIINEQETDDQEMENDSANNEESYSQNQASVFPIPFGSFKRCCDSFTFLNKQFDEFDESKLEFQWISGSVSNIMAEITGISLLLAWENRWLFEDKFIEGQFWKCFQCTFNKFEKGMFGQPCVGAIIAIYENMIIGCMIMHRFPLFNDVGEIDKYSLGHSVLNMSWDQISSSSKLDNDTKTLISYKNTYLYLDSFCIAPFFGDNMLKYIGDNMFEILFKTYPNELFMTSVVYENIKIWDNHQFIPFKEELVQRNWRKSNNNISQIYKILRLTSNEHG